MRNLEAIRYALGRVSDKSVVVFSRKQWERLISDTGEPTKINEAPEPLSRVMHQAIIVTVTASGIVNPSPGIDFVRYDIKDAPCVYNIDHYTVIENISIHEQYTRIFSMARVDDDEMLRAILRENVFIIGPERLSNHWSIELPEYIKSAKQKDN